VPATTVTAAGAVVAALHSGHVFPRSIMAGNADVARAIPRFVAVEVVEGLGTAFRQRTPIPVAGIKPVVDVPIESSGAMKPGTRPDE
jgi:hypothetical protein